MRSIWSVSLSLLSGLVLVGSLGDSVWAGDRHCVPCVASVPVATVVVPVLAVETRAVDTVIVVASENQALLILNCPADARVTIDGRLTHASGSTRQYRLRFDGDSHICPIEIRIRDNDEKATYRFETTFEFHAHQRVVLSIDRSQMEKISDRHPAEEVAKLMAPGTALLVTENGQLVPFVMPVRKARSKPTAVKAEQPSLQQLAIEHQTKQLDQERAAANQLAKVVTDKQTRYDAATRIRKQTEDAYQVKLAEVDAKSANPVEAKKLQVEITRDREVEQSAKDDVTAAQDQLNKAEQRVRDATTALKKAKGGSIQIELP